MQRIYLSRRNLEVLLSKLDRKKQGDLTACTIIKHQNLNDPFVQTMKEVAIIALEDEELYANRPAGAMNPLDEPPVRHETGTAMGSF